MGQDTFLHPELVNKWFEKLEFIGSDTTVYVLQSLCRYDSPEQAATFILDMGMIVMMLGENVSVAFRASVANTGSMALAAKSHGTLTAPNRTSRWIFVLMASLYAKLKGG